MRKRVLADVSPIENQLLEATTAGATILEMILSNPLTSCLAITGKEVLEAAVLNLQYKQQEYLNKGVLAENFVAWQQKTTAALQKTIEPTLSKLEKLRKEIESLEKDLKDKKDEYAALCDEKAEPTQLIAAYDANQSNAQKSCDNAGKISTVCGSLIEFLKSLIVAHKNAEAKQERDEAKKSNGDVVMQDDDDDDTPDVLALAMLIHPKELGDFFGITSFHQVEFAQGLEDGKPKPHTWHPLNAIVNVARFFGYEYSGACRSVYQSFPHPTTHTHTKAMMQMLVCKLCGVAPPSSLAITIHNEMQEKKQSQKRKRDAGDALHELVDKAHPDDINEAKNMEGGTFSLNLFMLHEKRLKRENESSRSNEA